MLQHVILQSGDTALIVNGHIVFTADPGLDRPADVESVAERLAAALGEPLQRIERPTPTSDEWTWDDVLVEAGIVQASEGGPVDHTADAPAIGPTHPEQPPGGYFVMYNFENSADHCPTLSQARKRGQELCDSDPLPATWSIHDADGELVEQIQRGDGKTLEDLVKAFKPSR